MKIKVDKQGFITDYAFIGDLVDSIEIADPKDTEHFEQHFTAYRVRDGDIQFDADQEQKALRQQAVSDYRQKREVECFSVINRGQLWYDTLSEQQLTELDAWYQAWLNGTQTLTVPEKPAWLT